MIAIVTASNVYGEAIDSSAGNGASIVQVPSAPVGLAFDPAVSTASVIGLTWNSGASTGGAAIIDYRISYDQSTDNEVVLATGITQ